MVAYSDAELLTAIQELADEYGRPPSLQEITDETKYSRSVFYSHFGSWQNAVEEAGYDPRSPQQAASKDDLIAELQRLTEELGHQPSIHEMNEHGAYWGSTYKNHFDSWQAAIEAAGLDTSKVMSKVSREDLTAELKRLDEAVEGKPTVTQMAQDGKYDPKTYYRTFGSWPNSLQTIGYDAEDTSDKIPEAELAAELRRLADELGKAPSQREMDTHGQHSHTTYVHHFGSWSTALETVLGDD